MFKKKKNDYSEAESNLNNSSKAADRLIIQKLNDDDYAAKELLLKLKDGYPLVLNFGDLDDRAANKMIAFMTGGTVVLDGKVARINETTFLFARKVDFLDGSLAQFINNLPK